MKQLLSLVLGITLLLSGCTKQHHPKPYPVSKKTGYHLKHDSAPNPKDVPKDLHKVPDAVPKAEPLSKYGNPKSYVVFNKRYHILKSSDGYKSTGHASWYGNKFHGYRTSSGEPYNMYAMTAAHKTLPIPTYVEVKNLANGKKVVVKVNDRGPFHGNRLLDLSYAAANKLGILATGTGKVQITALNPSKGMPTIRTKASPFVLANNKVATRKAPNKTLALGTEPVVKSIIPAGAASNYRYLQVGAFRDKANAEQLKQQIQELVGIASNKINVTAYAKAKPAIYRVRIGPIANDQSLQNLRSKIMHAKLPAPIAIP